MNRPVEFSGNAAQRGGIGYGSSDGAGEGVGP